LEGPGPILFRQTRVGFNNRHFQVLKFRSMKPSGIDDASQGTRRNDPRVTRVERVIRKYSIDELPQLFNVLKGEMVTGAKPRALKRRNAPR
jgi:putative colanic acid biosynthesis UDP-glucose lipid carrier transferase